MRSRPAPRDDRQRSAKTRRRLAHLLIATGLVLASCERTPSKSDYVSAQVSEQCAEERGDALRACRIAVIKAFKDTPLEELQARFPAPEPRARPSCGF